MLLHLTACMQTLFLPLLTDLLYCIVFYYVPSLVYWTRYQLNTADINTTYNEVLTLNPSDESPPHGGSKTLLTSPVQPSFPSELLRDPTYASDVSYLIMDCLLHQRDRKVTLEELFSTT